MTRTLSEHLLRTIWRMALRWQRLRATPTGVDAANECGFHRRRKLFPIPVLALAALPQLCDAMNFTEHYYITNIGLNVAKTLVCERDLYGVRRKNPLCQGEITRIKEVANSASDPSGMTFTVGDISGLVDYAIDELDLLTPGENNDSCLEMYRWYEGSASASVDAYLSASSVNDAHFGKSALTWLETMHTLSRAYARRSQSCGNAWLIAEAIAQHFLEDIAMPGHLTTTRKIGPAVLALEVHDYFNARGGDISLNVPALRSMLSYSRVKPDAQGVTEDPLHALFVELGRQALLTCTERKGEPQPSRTIDKGEKAAVCNQLQRYRAPIEFPTVLTARIYGDGDVGSQAGAVLVAVASAAYFLDAALAADNPMGADANGVDFASNVMYRYGIPDAHDDSGCKADHTGGPIIDLHAPGCAVAIAGPMTSSDKFVGSDVYHFYPYARIQRSNLRFTDTGLGFCGYVYTNQNFNSPVGEDGTPAGICFGVDRFSYRYGYHDAFTGEIPLLDLSRTGVKLGLAAGWEASHCESTHWGNTFGAFAETGIGGIASGHFGWMKRPICTGPYSTDRLHVVEVGITIALGAASFPHALSRLGIHF